MGPLHFAHSLNRTRLLVLLLILILAGCSAASSALRESKASAERGEWEESARLLQQALNDKPKDSEIKLQLTRARWEASMGRLRKGQALLDAKQYAEAINELQVSLSFDPSNLKTLELIQVARKRQDAALQVQQGHTFIRLNKTIQGREAFEKALALDPQNIQARQALDYYKKDESVLPRLPLKIDSQNPVSLRFKSTPLINAFEVISRLSGINFIFDNQVKDTKVTLFMTDVPLDRFLEALFKTNGLAAKVLDDKTVLIYNATPAKSKEYQDLEIRTFYLTNIEAKKASEMLTKILKSRDVIANEKLNTVVIRGSHAQVELAAKVVEANDRAPAEVMLNVELLEVSRGKEQQLGIEFSESIGLGFGKGSTRGSVIKDSSSSITGTQSSTRSSTNSQSSSNTSGSTSTQDATGATTSSSRTSSRSNTSSPSVSTSSNDSQSTSSTTNYAGSVVGGVTSLGGALIDAATGAILDGAALPIDLGSTVISAYDLANLSTKELLLGLPSAKINLLKQDQDTRILANPQLRVKHAEKASILIGSRVPLVTNRRLDSTTGDVTNDYQYYDVGVKLEAEPQINLHNDVKLKLNLEVSALGENRGTTDDPRFEIRTRNAQSMLSLRDGEPVILGGLISDEERKTYRSVPMIGDVPILGRLFSNENSSGTATDIIMIITPIVVRSQDIPSAEIASFWSGSDTDFSLRTPFESSAGKQAALLDAPRPEYFSTQAENKPAPAMATRPAPPAAAPHQSPAATGVPAEVPGALAPPAAGDSSTPVATPPAEAPASASPEAAAGLVAPLATSEAEGRWPEGVNFSIQVASYTDAVDAQQRVSELTRMGHSSFWIRAQVPGKGTFFRVLVGRYASHAEAVAALRNLKARPEFRADAYVVNRSSALGQS